MDVFGKYREIIGKTGEDGVHSPSWPVLPVLARQKSRNKTLVRLSMFIIHLRESLAVRRCNTLPMPPNDGVACGCSDDALSRER